MADLSLSVGGTLGRSHVWDLSRTTNDVFLIRVELDGIPDWTDANGAAPNVYVDADGDRIYLSGIRAKRGTLLIVR